MSITYRKKRTREMRHTCTEAEYQDLLKKLVHYLSIIAPGDLTLAHKQKAFIHLRLGINATHITYRK